MALHLEQQDASALATLVWQFTPTLGAFGANSREH
jgi:hypothetical protein